MPAFNSNASFPLIKTRPRVAFLDDDAQFIDALMTVLSQEASAQFFTKTAYLDEALTRTRTARQAEQALWAALGSSVAASQLSSAFAYLSNKGRSSVFCIIVVDHMMPGERGRDYCARHADEGLYRILLTGMADNDLAVAAFNAGDIDYFIPKQSRGLLTKLGGALRETQSRLDARAAAGLQAAADPLVIAALNEPSIRQDLTRLMSDYGVEEYIFLNQPLGISAITGDGHQLWFQLETPQSLQELANLLAESQAAPEQIQLVQQGLQTVNIELASQLPGQSEPGSAKLISLGTTGTLSAGVFGLAGTRP